MPRRRLLWIEVGVMASLYFIPALWSSVLVASAQVSAPRSSIMPIWVYLANPIVGYFRRLVPAIFIIWASGEGLASFGIRGFVWWRGLIYMFGGMFVYLALSGVMGWVSGAFDQAAQFVRSPRLHASPDYLGIVLYLFGECIYLTLQEFTLRGYLIPRLRELTGNAWFSVLASTILYTAIHLREGWAASVVYFGTGLFFALSLRATRSIWPAVMAGFLVNTIPYLMSRLG